MTHVFFIVACIIGLLPTAYASPALITNVTVRTRAASIPFDDRVELPDRAVAEAWGREGVNGRDDFASALVRA